MNLYIDCDDTLVLWLDEWEQPLERKNPYDAGSQKWILNDPLIDAIKKWYMTPLRGDVIIWSGGGSQYSYRWAGLAFMRDPRNTDHQEMPPPELDRPLQRLMVSRKDMRVPKHDDIVVDDQKLVMEARPNLFTPDEFINRMGTRYFDWTGIHVRTPIRQTNLSSRG